MTLAIAVLLGIIQGIFMFLPVSSTAHLVLTQHWLIEQGHALPAPESAEMILFDLIVHVGTLVSIAVVFWHSLARFTRNAASGAVQLASRNGDIDGLPLFLRLFLLGMLSFTFTAVIGLLLKASFEFIFATPTMIAFTLMLTGALLWWTDKLKPRKRGLKQITPMVAAIIGTAQGFALMPGLSRSAMTIVFALFTGLKRRWAAEYSFFLAIPTILAATLLQAIEVYRSAEQLNGLNASALLTGFVVAAIVGILALKLVIYFLYRAQLKVFSFYVWGLAALIFTGVITLPV